MADSDGVPPWVNFVLDRVDTQFEAVFKRLDTLVTQEAFRQEQTRVNERLASQDAKIADLSAGLTSEATARNTENTIRMRDEAGQKDRLAQTQKQTQWQWFVLVASPIIAYLVGQFGPQIGGGP